MFSKDPCSGWKFLKFLMKKELNTSTNFGVLHAERQNYPTWFSVAYMKWNNKKSNGDISRRNYEIFDHTSRTSQ